jgi:hypothetical protein
MQDRELLGDVPLGKLGGAKVLVVDDDEEIRTFLVTLLSDEGALTFEAADGIEALEVAERRSPDLITLDLSMPGKDGIDTFTDLRQNPATAEIAVCFITGHPEFCKVVYDRPVTPPGGLPQQALRLRSRSRHDPPHSRPSQAEGGQIEELIDCKSVGFDVLPRPTEVTTRST